MRMCARFLNMKTNLFPRRQLCLHIDSVYQILQP